MYDLYTHTRARARTHTHTHTHTHNTQIHMCRTLARNAAAASVAQDTCTQAAQRDSDRELMRFLAEEVESRGGDRRAEAGLLGILVSTSGTPLGAARPAGVPPPAADWSSCKTRGWWFGDAALAGVLEPVATKRILFTECFSLLYQLLRLGEVVAVPRAPRTHCARPKLAVANVPRESDWEFSASSSASDSDSSESVED